MELFQHIAPLRAQLQCWRQQSQRLAFVPTMGNLHAGHLSLVEAARQQADKVIVSIFVNPTQFNDPNDLLSYPRTLEHDLDKLTTVCDAVFFPTEAVIYPTGSAAAVSIIVPEITQHLCGYYRPGHFAGVATVIVKLLNIVQPDYLLLGEKDYQQLLVVKRLVADLQIMTQVMAVETYRESNGLAMSSRNQHLTACQKETASALYQQLGQIKNAIEQGNRDYKTLIAQASQKLQQKGFEVEYLAVCRDHDLQPAEKADTKLRILIAVYIDKVRLIDNIACYLA